MRAVSGLVRPDSGSIRIGDRDVTNAPIKGRGVSMVFQSFALYPHLTVFKNLAYPLIEDGVPSNEINRRVRETAQMLKLAHRLEQKPATLSGGEQQRVALGRSLIGRPDFCCSTSRSPISTPSSGTTCARSSSGCTASSA